MGVHNKLPPDALRAVNRSFAWLLIIFGYAIALAMATDNAGWDDPVFNMVRAVPYTPYSWAAILAASVTVYAAGEITSELRHWRGWLVILGSFMCAAWCFALGLAMSRVVYEMPQRVTDLWPILMLFISTLYASRVVVYANAFTGSRWATNPYQLWAVQFLMIVSLAQMVIGVAPTSVFTEVEHPAALMLASVNFLGSAVVMFGLHLKNTKMGINLELAGSVSLVATLVWYCFSVVQKENLAGTTLGFGVLEGIVLATLHRSVQILTLQWARLRGQPTLERRMERALNPADALSQRDVAHHGGP